MNVINQAAGEGWSLYHGDSVEVLAGLPSDCVDFCLYSPPFDSLFTYTPSTRDVGNCRSREEFYEQLGYVSRQVLRLLKPGRIMAVHSMDLPTTQTTHGVTGLSDFTGGLIRHYLYEGFVYHGRVTIDRCPQQLAIRNKAKQLLFVQMDRDRSWLSPAFPDYLLLFRAPGVNEVPVRDDSLTREDWIKFARPVWPSDTDDRAAAGSAIWYDIRETNTLNVRQAREDADERHVCPLNLDVIDRAVRLWSQKGEVVLSPFAGIGSEGVGAIALERKFIGVELKRSYYETACSNLQRAEEELRTPTLFDFEEAPAPAAPRRPPGDPGFGPRGTPWR